MLDHPEIGDGNLKGAFEQGLNRLAEKCECVVQFVLFSN